MLSPLTEGLAKENLMFEFLFSDLLIREKCIPVAEFKSNNWAAWVDLMPGPGASGNLVVIGYVETNNPDDVPKLILSDQDPNDPTLLILDLYICPSDFYDPKADNRGRNTRIDQNRSKQIKKVRINGGPNLVTEQVY